MSLQICREEMAEPFGSWLVLTGLDSTKSCKTEDGVYCTFSNQFLFWHHETLTLCTGSIGNKKMRTSNKQVHNTEMLSSKHLKKLKDRIQHKNQPLSILCVTVELRATVLCLMQSTVACEKQHQATAFCLLLLLCYYCGNIIFCFFSLEPLLEGLRSPQHDTQ